MIRKGTLDDVAEMAKIFNFYVATSTVIFSERQLSADEFAPKLDGVVGEYPFYIAEDADGTMIGYCYAHRWMPDPVYGRSWEVTIYLNHNYLGKGFGRQLLKNVIDDSRFTFIQQNFRYMKNFLQLYCGGKVDGILADLGVSSYQYILSSTVCKYLFMDLYGQFVGRFVGKP